MKRAAKRDDNEQAIVDRFVARGWLVERISAAGVPDLLVGFYGVLMLVEVKRGKAGKLTTAQQAFHAKWKGYEIHVVRDVDDVDRLIDGLIVVGDSLPAAQ